MKPRHHLYLDDDLTAELEYLASKPDASKSAIVAAALRQYIRRGGGDGRDEAIRQRLDRLSRQVAKLTSNLDMVLDTQSQHVWLHLMLTANVPSPDETGRSIASQRYDKFLDSVAARVVKRSKYKNDADEDMSQIAIADEHESEPDNQGSGEGVRNG